MGAFCILNWPRGSRSRFEGPGGFFGRLGPVYGLANVYGTGEFVNPVAAKIVACHDGSF